MEHHKEELRWVVHGGKNGSSSGNVCGVSISIRFPDMILSLLGSLHWT